jgi:spore germination protein KA/spore germination protein
LINHFYESVEYIQSNVSGLSKRIIECPHGTIAVLFIKQLTDRMLLSDYIIKPLVGYASEKKKLLAKEIADRILYVDDCMSDNVENRIPEYLLNGCTVLLFSWDENYLVSNIKRVESKNIESPELNYTVRGPRDCFVEILDKNLSLIRYRIKDQKLKIKLFEVGIRTKTTVAVSYIEDIANRNIVNDVIQRITNLKIDGIVESGELQSMILDNEFNLFPQTGLVERSDMACNAMLEGKIVIIVEGSCLALIAPKTFNEFLTACDDIYDNKYLGLFMKILRSIAIFLSFTLGALYIAIVSFHNDTLPSEYILTLATLRADVPFNAFTGILILEIIVEILRESLLRIPKKIGSAIGIVGAIIIGQAAIASGVFSPLLLIVVSTSMLASFAIPDYTLINPFRILKFFMMILSAVFGLIGFTMGLCFVVTNIISSNSFGIAYTAPSAPFNLYDFVRSYFYSKSFSPSRARFLKTKDQDRMKQD